jgi:hypothetical protein
MSFTVDSTAASLHSPRIPRRVFRNREWWELAYKEHVSHHPGTTRLIDNAWINTNVLRDWIQSCDTCHGDICRRGPLFQEQDLIRPRYLVDCIRQCVTSGHETKTGYIALSYQWGRATNLRNTSQICGQLSLPGSLAVAEIHSQIPQTIRDAIAVVKLLGYQYLWVDALCIVSTYALDLSRSQNHLLTYHTRYKMTMSKFKPKSARCTASTEVMLLLSWLMRGLMQVTDSVDSKALLCLDQPNR